MTIAKANPLQSPSARSALKQSLFALDRAVFEINIPRRSNVFVVFFFPCSNVLKPNGTVPNNGVVVSM